MSSRDGQCVCGGGSRWPHTLACPALELGPGEWLQWALKSGDEVSSVRVDFSPRHAHVKIWNRGGYAGELTIERRDWREYVRRFGVRADEGLRISPTTRLYHECAQCGVILPVTVPLEHKMSCSLHPGARDRVTFPASLGAAPDPSPKEDEPPKR